MSAIDDLKEHGMEHGLMHDRSMYLAILELDAMFKDHINKYHFIQYPPKTAKMPPTGPILNDGKGRFDPDTHLPFVTGLSKAKPTTDPYCSFCGGEHEYRNLFPGLNATICRSCIVAAERWKADDANPTPTDEEMVEKYCKMLIKVTDTFYYEQFKIILAQLIAEVRS